MQIAPNPVTRAVTPKPADEPKVNAVRSGIADGIRALGAGYADLGSQMSVTVDKASIYPIESVGAAGTVLRAATKPVPVLRKVGSMTATGSTFVAAFQGMVLSSMMTAPGSMVSDLANMLADKVDGKKSYDGSLGFGFAAAEGYRQKLEADAAAGRS